MANLDKWGVNVAIRRAFQAATAREMEPLGLQPRLVNRGIALGYIENYHCGRCGNWEPVYCVFVRPYPAPKPVYRVDLREYGNTRSYEYQGPRFYELSVLPDELVAYAPFVASLANAHVRGDASLIRQPPLPTDFWGSTDYRDLRVSYAWSRAARDACGDSRPVNPQIGCEVQP